MKTMMQFIFVGAVLTVVVIVWLIVFVRSAGAGELPKLQIIDMHCHTAGVGAGGSGAFVSPKLRRSWRYHLYLRSFGVKEKELLDQGDSLIISHIADGVAQSRYVDKAVVLALDGVVDERGELDVERTEMYVPNDFVAREIKRYPNLLFGASVNPYRHDALERLDQAAAEGAVLMKWLPAIQHIDPADERIIPFYNRLRELDLPLLVHTGDEHSFTTAENKYGDPMRLKLPLQCGVKVIAAHAATTGKSEGEDNMKRLLKMFPSYPNLYTDISSLTQINKLFYLPRLLKHRDAHDRLIYGTDMPLLTTGIVSPWFYCHRLSLKTIFRCRKHGNPWDRDVLLKMALGVPAEVFEKGNGVLRLPKESAE